MTKNIQRYCNALFPDLKGMGTWGHVDLNSFAIHMREIYDAATVASKCKDPYEFDKWVRFYHKLLGINYSYGGYLEDRKELWSGHYQEALKAVHYGVDFTVPECTSVHIPTDGVLIDKYIDTDQDGGWGGRLTFRTAHGHLLFGHLKITNTKKNYTAGDLIGCIAPSDTNGGWWPHLHVQLMKEFTKDVDGYGAHYDGVSKDYICPY